MSNLLQQTSLFQTRALLGSIFEFLPSVEIVAHLSRVCRSFHYALRDLPILWASLSRRHGWGECSRRRFIEHLRSVTCVTRSQISLDVLHGHSAGVVLLHAPTAHTVFNWNDGIARVNNHALLVSGGSAPSFEFKVWDLEQRKCVREFTADLPGAWTAAQLSDSHLVFARGGNAPAVSVSDFNTGSVYNCPSGVHTSSITALRFCPASIATQNYFADSSSGSPRLFCATGGYDRQVCVWNLHCGQMLVKLTDLQQAVWAVDIVQIEGQARTIWVLTGDDSHTVRLFRLDFEPSSPPWLSAGTRHSDNQGWDIAHGTWNATCVHELMGHSQTPICVRFDPQQPDHFAFSSSYDGTVRRWNLVTGQCDRTYVGANSAVFAMDVSDPFVIYSCGRDETLRVHDKQTGDLLFEWILKSGQRQFDLKAVQCLPDGRVAVASYDGTVSVIEFSRRRLIQPLTRWSDSGSRPPVEPECAIM